MYIYRHQQVTDIIVDSRIYLQTSGKMFMGDRKRMVPDTFRFLTGSFLARVTSDILYDIV